MLLPSFGSRALKRLEKRKGGGGGGRGGGGSSGGRQPSSGSSPSPKGGGSSPKGGGTGSTGSSGGGGRQPASVPVSGLPKGSKGSSSYGQGGGRPVTIPAGTVFAGRTSGGGTRDQVFGSRYVVVYGALIPIILKVSRTYGSGYPSLGSRSVAGRNFPFGYWPIIWGAGIGAGSAAYLHSNEVRSYVSHFCLEK